MILAIGMYELLPDPGASLWHDFCRSRVLIFAECGEKKDPLPLVNAKTWGASCSTG